MGDGKGRDFVLNPLMAELGNWSCPSMEKPRQVAQECHMDRNQVGVPCSMGTVLQDPWEAAEPPSHVHNHRDLIVLLFVN